MIDEVVDGMVDGVIDRVVDGLVYGVNDEVVFGVISCTGVRDCTLEFHVVS